MNDNYTIIEDFDLACEFGYGQFIWSSANYLKDDESLNGQTGNNASASEASMLSSEHAGLHYRSAAGASAIPAELSGYASNSARELWQLTTNEIMTVLKCDAKEAKAIKSLCNATRES